MKNIHLIATDKPTGIFQSNSGLQFSIRDKVRVEPLKGFHIYITNDEVIKEGAWRCDIELNRIEKGKETGTFKNWKKIILTTDQDLIKDGVRAIGDDFLEWFVKNPSCEFVEVELKTKHLVKPYDVYNEQVSYYKIIIPKEEAKFISGQPFLEKADEVIVIHRPKQDTVGKEFYESADKVITVYRQEKKPHSFCETPEEKCTMNYCDENGCQNRVRHLVEPKQEQDKKMYSEEDMIEFAVWMYLEVGSNKGKERTNKELFEQFKKEIKE
jgi:hypothetical protein